MGGKKRHTFVTGPPSSIAHCTVTDSETAGVAAEKKMFNDIQHPNKEMGGNPKPTSQGGLGMGFQGVWMGDGLV